MAQEGYRSVIDRPVPTPLCSPAVVRLTASLHRTRPSQSIHLVPAHTLVDRDVLDCIFLCLGKQLIAIGFTSVPQRPPALDGTVEERDVTIVSQNPRPRSGRLIVLAF